ncbi:MAG: PAS domain S-box protein [Planctomycetes bacterium]|nr:PAS domain S-box protein [Planctomycetota bacterium]
MSADDFVWGRRPACAAVESSVSEKVRDRKREASLSVLALLPLLAFNREDLLLTSIFGVLLTGILWLAWKLRRGLWERLVAQIAQRESETKYRALFENAKDAIYLIDPDTGRILDCNPAAAEMLGYAAEQMRGMPTADLHPANERRVAAEKLQQVREQGRALEIAGVHHQRQDGTLVPVDITAQMIRLDSRRLIVAVVRNVSQQRRLEETIRKLIRVSSAHRSQAFFESVVRELAESLQADSVHIGEWLEPEGKVRTIAAWKDGRVVANFEYDLSGSPCEQVVGQTLRCWPADLPERFRRSCASIGEGIEAFVAAPLFDSRSRPVGVLAVAFRNPIADPSFCEHILQVFAARVGPEIELSNTEREARQWMRELSALNALSQRLISDPSLDQAATAALDGVLNAINPDLTLLFLRKEDRLELLGDRSREPTFPNEPTPIHKVGECLCGLAAENGQPVFSRDIRHDARCSWEDCKKAGLKSFAALPLVTGGKVIGVLGVASRTERDFRRDSDFLQTLAQAVSVGLQNSLLHERQRRYAEELEAANRELSRQIAEREEAQKRLSSALQQKVLLLREVHHRVKNNLQIISSLLRLQTRQAGVTAGDEVIEKSQIRIRAIALVHELLYRSSDLAHVDLMRYLSKLVEQLRQVYGIESSRVECHIEGVPVLLTIDQAVPVALVLNELVSNSFRHAFPQGRSGQITVTVQRDEDQFAEITVRDNGTSLQRDFDLEKMSGLGLQLVSDLVHKQLRGSLTIESNGGTRFVVRFPIARIREAA